MTPIRGARFVGLVALGACAASDERPSESILSARVDSIFAAHVPGDAPGCAVGVYRDGQLLLAKGYGVASLEDGRPIMAHTTFDLGSVSKQFTALAVLMLEKAGRLTVDDDVRRYVPELRDYGTPIRIRDLLQHTSGVRDFETLDRLTGQHTTTMAGFVDLIAGQRALNFTPGTRHEYSHSDFGLLALVVGRLTGAPFGRYLEREVFQPLGMTDSYVYDGSSTRKTDRAYGHIESSERFLIHFPTQLLTGGENVYTSVTDLHRWDQNFADAKVGGRALIDRMLTLPTLANGDTIPYAFGLRHDTYRGLRTMMRGGNSNGSRTEIIRFPSERFTVTTLCNGSHLPPGTLGEAVATVYIGDKMQPLTPDTDPDPPAVPITPADLARYAGVYAESAADLWNALRLEVRNGKLVELLGDTIQTFTHVGNGRFSGDGSPGFFHTITLGNSGAGARLETSYGGKIDETLQRVDASAIWRPSASELDEYAGTYFSEDVDAGWQLVLRDGRLLLRRRGRRDLALLPLKRDVFERAFGSWDDLVNTRIQFHRNGAGGITSFIVSTAPGEAAVNELRFDRVGTR